MRQGSDIKRAFQAAFPHTIPIFAGFWFLGLTSGIYMNASGFSFWYPCLMSLTIFAGSVEFVTVNMLLGAFDPLQALTMTLMINARHLFYGISMPDRYKRMAESLLYRHESPDYGMSASCSSYRSLGKRWKRSSAGCRGSRPNIL